MKDWRNEGSHAYTGEEIPDIPDALRVGLYMVRGTQLVHYYGAYSNAHRGVARRRESFVDVPSEDDYKGHVPPWREAMVSVCKFNRTF